MPLNFYGDDVHGDDEPAIADSSAATSGAGPASTAVAEEEPGIYFGQPIGYFPIDLRQSEELVGEFLAGFRAAPDLTEHDRGVLVDGMEVLDAQLNAVKDAGGIYFAYGMHPDEQLGFAESYLALYVREVGLGNPRAVLAGFAEAAAAESAVKAVSRRDFAGGPAVLAEYERVLDAVSTDSMPARDIQGHNERVTLHQLQAAFATADGDRIAILELTSRHTHLWEHYRDVLLATAETVTFEAPGGEGGADDAQPSDAGGAQMPAVENVHTRLNRLLG